MPKQVIARAAVVLFAGVLLVTQQTHAQERDPAAAQALFDEARTLMSAQHYAEACKKLAESLRVDPGIGTQFNLASCYEHEGKLASAWAAFLEVASLATASGQDARAQAASRRASLLEGRLPRLTIKVPVAARAPGLEITRDGVVVGEAQWEIALPADPGEHRVEVTAPGKRAFAGAVSVAEGTTVSFEVPPLESASASVAEPTTPLASTPPAPQVTPPAPVKSPEPAPSAPSSGPGALVIGLGVFGVVAIGAGSALGLMAKAKNEDSKAQCNPDDRSLCNQKGVEMRNQALLLGNLATTGFIVGGAALVGAGVLWLVSGGSEGGDGNAAVSVRVGPTAVGAAVQGRF